MLNPDLNKLCKGNTSRYSLVIAAAKRAREITDEALEEEKIITEKPVSTALNEFINGNLEIVEPEEIKNL